MISYHDRIKRQFGRSAQGQYDNNVRVQLIMAAELADWVQKQYISRMEPPPAPSSILEIGCGTGNLTSLLARMQLLNSSRITAIDISSAMLEAARRKVNASNPEAIERMHWIEADAEHWVAERRPHGHEPYSLIVSSACFQWFVHPARTLRALRESLRPGGMLAFTTFGPRTMHELHTSFQHAYEQLGLAYRHHGLSFHSLSEWQDMLCSAGFQLLEGNSHEHIETHRSVPDFLHAVKAVGASAASEDAQRTSIEHGAGRRIFREMFRCYESLFPAPGGIGITATYETITIIATRD